MSDGKGIRRFAHAVIPMDESVATVALDCGGRGYLVFTGTFGNKVVGTIPADIFEHFLLFAVQPCRYNPHIAFTGKERPPQVRGGVQGIRDCPRGSALALREKGGAEHEGNVLRKFFFFSLENLFSKFDDALGGSPGGSAPAAGASPVCDGAELPVHSTERNFLYR